MSTITKLLNNLPAPRVTEEQIKANIQDVKYTRFTDTVTICNITLNNGFSVRGESACVSPENYNQVIGEDFAYKDAFKKLWPLFGFHLAQTQYDRSQSACTQGVAV